MQTIPVEQAASHLKEIIEKLLPGEEVIITPAVSDADAMTQFPEGWRAVKPYLRYVRQPK